MFLHNILLGLAFAWSSFPALSADSSLSGEIRIDGSSTVLPIAKAAADEFQRVHPGTRVQVGLSGTGGGFKKFAALEIDVTNASRRITAPEVRKLAASKVAYLELPIAYDGIAVVVNQSNSFVKAMSIKMLRELWEPGSRVKTWKHLDPSWPDQPIKLYGPGPESGTFDFFTEHVMGTARLSRNDFLASEDDNVLVNAVSQDPQALGYLGFSYLEENKQLLRNVPVQSRSKSAMLPTAQSIQDGSYALSRPLLLYVNLASARRPEVRMFIEFLLKNAAKLVKKAGYVPLPESEYVESQKKFQSALQSGKQTHEKR
jgi:phosphate transport system substrate-binding protein